MNVNEYARKLHEARINRQETPSLRTGYTFDLEEAYRIQDAGLALRHAEGEKSIGVKLGFTSKGVG